MADTETIRDVAEALARLDALPCLDHLRRLDRHEERLVNMEGCMQTIKAERRIVSISLGALGALIMSVAGILVQYLLFRGGSP